MKAQMRFQKYICLAMLIVGALSLLYAFCYCTGGLSELGFMHTKKDGVEVSVFKVSEGKYGYELYEDIQPINTLLMYFGIIMVLLAVLLYITACNKRRKYYVTNYVAIGACAGGNIVISIVALVLNGIWRGKFLDVDFESWKAFYDKETTRPKVNEDMLHYSDSTLWFDIGFAVYTIVIVASIVLILNLVWKILLMKGEKKLLDGNNLAGGVAA